MNQQKFIKGVNMRKILPLKRIEYFTNNSWNRETAPAYNLKIYNVIGSSDLKNKLYDLIYLPGFYDEINFLIEKFEENNPGYSAGFNGRSGGYLVLYRSNTCRGFKASEVNSEVLKNFRKLALDIVKQVIYQAENGRIDEVEIVNTIKIFTLD